MGDEHFELEKERMTLHSALWEVKAVMRVRANNHAYVRDYIEFINRLKIRLKTIEGRLNDSKAK